MNRDCAPGLVASVPVLMVTGFLGAGKTTFLNMLMEKAGWQNTVFVVNEFGETGIDQRLLPDQNGVHLLADGCICCANGGDLSKTLARIVAEARRGQYRVDRIVVETSGIALPTQIVGAISHDPVLSEACYVASVLTVLDASQLFDQIDHYPEVVDQIAAADLIYVSKTDLPSAGMERIDRAISDINPLCSVYPRDRFAADVPKVIQSAMAGCRQLPRRLDGGHAPKPHRRALESFSIDVPMDVPIARFSEFADAITYLLGDRILRAKGFVKLREHTRWASINIVKKSLYPPTFTDLTLSPADARLIFITEDLGRDVLVEFLDIALAETPRVMADV